jgi:hypothetical protein
MIRGRSIVERRDGTSIEFFDAGEIDADGRIATLLVFAGPLADLSEDLGGRARTRAHAPEAR